MNKATQLGHAGAQLAADHADKVNNDWQLIAYNSLLAHAKTHEFFTIEQVRLYSAHVPKPPSERAWGQIAIMAHKAGIISRSSIQATTNKTAHGCFATVWRSLIVDYRLKCRREYDEVYNKELSRI